MSDEAFLRESPECQYDGNPDVTPHRNREQALQSSESQKQELLDLIAMLRNRPSDEVGVILQQLERDPDPYRVVSLVKAADLFAPGPSARGTSLSTSSGPSKSAELTRSLLSPTDGGIDFELTIRHCIAYPKLPYISSSSLPVEELCTPDLDGSSSQDTSSHALTTSTDPTSPTGPTGPKSQSFALSRDSLDRLPSIIDGRLQSADISYWTRIPVAHDVAVQAMSLYFEMDYHILPLFDYDLFLTDLTSRWSQFCSSLLVNALLSWCFQAYTTLHTDAAPLSHAFMHEAQSLLPDQAQDIALTDVSALQLLSMACTTYGRDDLAVQYLRDGISLATRLGLFSPRTTEPTQRQYVSREYDIVASHTAWGVFIWVSVHCLHFHNAALESPPTLPTPGTFERTDTPETLVSPPSRLHVQVFDAQCRLWVIFHEIASSYYNSYNTKVSLVALSEFAEATYRRLLQWAEALPLQLARASQETPANSVFLRYFETRATADDIYHASVNQLKRLVLTSRMVFRRTTTSVLWQTGLVYLANAMLQEANSQESHFYLLMCVVGLTDLYSSFRVFGPITEGTLGMALKTGAMTRREIGRIKKQLLQRRRRYIFDDISFSTADDTQIKWVLDLDLAVVDSAAARGAALVKEFRMLSFSEADSPGPS
ncbi:hypothetical protein Daus18300_003045 [Diaporthe australafricana]|uniref:Transcription factor domain-containing protein n=1 Tax=Diaporthe australafricana TaxID=127596 RepID=A0ABR3XJR3_9PEZI